MRREEARRRIGQSVYIARRYKRITNLFHCRLAIFNDTGKQMKNVSIKNLIETFFTKMKKT